MIPQLHNIHALPLNIFLFHIAPFSAVPDMIHLFMCNKILTNLIVNIEFNKNLSRAYLRQLHNFNDSWFERWTDKWKHKKQKQKAQQFFDSVEFGPCLFELNVKFLRLNLSRTLIYCKRIKKIVYHEPWPPRLNDKNEIPTPLIQNFIFPSSIQSIDICTTRFNFLHALQNCSTLKELRLTQDCTCDIVKNMTNLRVLNCSHMIVDNLDHLPTSLEEIEIAGINTNDPYEMNLARFENLRSFCTRWTDSNIEMGFSRIYDQGILTNPLHVPSKLKELSVYKISDAVIQNCTQLEELCICTVLDSNNQQMDTICFPQNIRLIDGIFYSNVVHTLLVCNPKCYLFKFPIQGYGTKQVDQWAIENSVLPDNQGYFVLQFE